MLQVYLIKHPRKGIEPHLGVTFVSLLVSTHYPY